MKKTSRVIALVVFVFSLFFSGCGIDEFVYLYPVTQLLNSPPSDAESENYFSFRTSDEKNYSEYGLDSYFKGFEVYYRIYNSLDTRNSDVSAIYTYNDSNPTTALTYLVNTKNYHRMARAGRETEVPLIPGSSSNRTVSIRLYLYPKTTTYPAYFSIDGSLDGSGSLGIPERTLNSGTVIKTFDTASDNISTSDDDVTYTSSKETTIWYVQAYVVAYGYDSSYKALYSEVFGLGYVKLTE